VTKIRFSTERCADIYVYSTECRHFSFYGVYFSPAGEPTQRAPASSTVLTSALFLVRLLTSRQLPVDFRCFCRLHANPAMPSTIGYGTVTASTKRRHDNFEARMLSVYMIHHGAQIQCRSSRLAAWILILQETAACGEFGSERSKTLFSQGVNGMS
jgi:hypothetical protein